MVVPFAYATLGEGEVVYCECKRARHVIHPDLRSMVNFCYLNLAEDIYPSVLNDTNAMDVIFCRNVLMYLEKKKVGRILEHFRRSLKDGGWLAVGSAEISQVQSAGFEQCSYRDVSFFRKVDPPAEPPAEPMLDLLPAPTPAAEAPADQPSTSCYYQDALSHYSDGRYGQVIELLCARTQSNCSAFRGGRGRHEPSCKGVCKSGKAWAGAGMVRTSRFSGQGACGASGACANDSPGTGTVRRDIGGASPCDLS